MYGYGPRSSAGFSPYLRPRHGGRAGVSLMPAPGSVQQALSVLGQFATAQGGNPAIIAPSSAAMRGTREGLGFPNTSVPPNGSATATTVSQGIYRPSKMILVNSQDPLSGTSLSVSNILIGSETALVNTNPLIGSVFLPQAVECGVTFPTASPGITIAVTVTNNTASTTTAFITMLGEYVRGGGFEIGG